MTFRSPLALLGALLAPLVFTVPSIAEPVTLEQIMDDPLWIGNPPQDPYWSTDGRAVYFEQSRKDEDDTDLVRLELGGKAEAERIDGEAWGEIDVKSREVSRDGSRVVFERLGDVFVRRLADGKLRQLTRTVERESSPFFMAGDDAVAFRRGDAYFVRELDTGLEYQAADVRTEADPEAQDKDETFLESQQDRLFDVIREWEHRKEKKKEFDEARRRADPTAPPLPVYLGDGVSVVRGALSPAGDLLALVTAPEKRDEGREDHMPNYVTADGYVEIRDVRVKVGTAAPPDHALTLVDLAGSSATELDLSMLPGIADDPLASLRAAAEKKAKQENEEEHADEDGVEKEDEKDAEKKDAEPRSVEIEQLLWNPSGSRLAVQIHSYDNKDRWIALLEGGELRSVHRLSLEGWINWSFNEMGWVDDDRLWFLSEETGWSQLYLYDAAKDETARLTSWDAVVKEPVLSPDRAHLYFVANPDHPGTYDTFRAHLASREVEQISRLGGLSDFELSPDGKQLLIRHSSLLSPPELYLQEARPGAEAKRLTRTVTEAFTAVDWVKPEIVEVPSTRQDRPIYSRFYPAKNPDRLRGEDGKVPAVVFVHGAGYLQNAHKGWSGYFREFMFHTLLAEQGYHVLDMDYRASAGYGVDWRTAIYRQMGTPELEDLQDGVAWLLERHGVDGERVGVYGGSYGGFMTMMALFKDPDLFAAGAALRPVTDWAHYNHPYTSNILNTPDVDPEAYARSSPIEFADGLENPLLICAPMLDDNVFFQDTVRLTQRLIELGITDFEVALYPVEPHGFRRPSSWLDEYRRIFRHFEENLHP